MTSAVKHVCAMGVTILWIRFGLAPVMAHGSALLSGGTCFVGDMSIGRSWSLAVVGAVFVGLPALWLSVLIDRGYVRYWLVIVLSVIGLGLGAIPFVLCRFPTITPPPESLWNGSLVVLLAIALCFSVYSLALLVAQRFQTRGRELPSQS
jgi:hypothetical protein